MTDRSSRLPSPPTSVATELIRIVPRLVFFGALVVLALVWLRGRRLARSA